MNRKPHQSLQMIPISMTLSDLWPRFQGHGVTINAVDVLCAQLSRDLFAIAKFLLKFERYVNDGSITKLC